MKITIENLQKFKNDEKAVLFSEGSAKFMVSFYCRPNDARFVFMASGITSFDNFCIEYSVDYEIYSASEVKAPQQDPVPANGSDPFTAIKLISDLIRGLKPGATLDQLDSQRSMLNKMFYDIPRLECDITDIHQGIIYKEEKEKLRRKIDSFGISNALSMSENFMPPKWLVAEARVKELTEAINRYDQAGHVPNPEWQDELRELEEYLRNRKENTKPEKPERILCAAIDYSAKCKNEEQSFVAVGLSYELIRKDWSYNKLFCYETGSQIGFLTTHNRFVQPREAFRIAVDAEQIPFDGNEKLSEMEFKPEDLL